MSRNIKYLYGVCQNIDYKDGNKCPLCETNEKQKKRLDEDFVCSECGEPLRRVAAPKTFWQQYGTMIVIIAVLAVLAGIVFGVIKFMKNRPATPEPEPEPVEAIDTTIAEPVDSTKQAEEIVEPVAEPEPVVAKPKPTNASSRKDLGYATWKGRMKNGLPDDENGTMTYKEKHLIDSRDPQGRYAESGDYIIGEFSEGKLVQGIWYDKSNTVKGSIIIGK